MDTHVGCGPGYFGCSIASGCRHICLAAAIVKETHICIPEMTIGEAVHHIVDAGLAQTKPRGVVENPRVRNAFIVSVALADLLVTSLLIPSSTILLLAGIDDSLSVCKFQWFLAACAFLVSVLSLSTTAVENYLRLCTSQENSNKTWFNKTSTTVILLLIWFVGGTSSGLQFVFSLSFDYCTRKSTGIVPYQMAIVALLIVLPIILTFYTHVRIILDVRRFMGAPNFKPSLAYTI
uniref:G-protein coupled receptors family 1 profile domain-containing protein n=1 Tax=Phlebotomus papatasi TaxID=29031 RepID=A0A1B0GQ08_PHLPP